MTVNIGWVFNQEANMVKNNMYCRQSSSIVQICVLKLVSFQGKKQKKQTNFNTVWTPQPQPNFAASFGDYHLYIFFTLELFHSDTALTVFALNVALGQFSL